MATAEQMLQAIMAQMQLQSAQIVSQQAAQQQQAEQHAQQMAAMSSMMAGLQMQIANNSSASNSANSRDLHRDVSKPANFNPVENNFPDWSFKFRNWIANAFGKEARSVLTWSIDQDVCISDAIVHDELVVTNRFPKAAQLNEHMYAIFTQILLGEALDFAKNTVEGSGLEVWRKICRRWDPQTESRNQTALLKIMQPPKCRLSDILAGIEKIEEQIRVYESRSGEIISQGMRCCVLQAMCVEPLSTHIALNMLGIGKDYQKMREVITTFAESALAASLDQSVPVPMDTSALQALGFDANDAAVMLDALKGKGKGKGKGGMGQGKGAAARFTGDCFNCGRPGHKAEECRSPPRPQRPALVHTPTPKAKAKVKGKGKGKKGLQALEDQPTADVHSFLAVGCVTEQKTDVLDSMCWHEAESQGWTKLYLTVDSGAAASAMNRQIAPSIPVVPTATSKAGRKFKVASGHLVDDEGGKTLEVYTECEFGAAFNFDIACVHKPLVAVSRLNAHGVLAHLEPGNSYVQIFRDGPHKGKKFPLLEKQGLFFWVVWLPPASGGVANAVQVAALSNQSETPNVQVFQRQVISPGARRELWGRTL